MIPHPESLTRPLLIGGPAAATEEETRAAPQPGRENTAGAASGPLAAAQGAQSSATTEISSHNFCSVCEKKMQDGFPENGHPVDRGRK